MAVIIPFPVSRSRAATRAARIFQAQVELEQTRKQAMLFFGASVLVVGAMLTLLEVASRL